MGQKGLIVVGLSFYSPTIEKLEEFSSPSPKTENTLLCSEFTFLPMQKKFGTYFLNFLKFDFFFSQEQNVIL
jgi:hypothetical protein